MLTSQTVHMLQLHLARLVLQPDVDASPALRRFFDSCHRAACASVTRDHEQTKSSAREEAVVQALRKCLRGSDALIQVQVSIALCVCSDEA